MSYHNGIIRILTKHKLHVICITINHTILLYFTPKNKIISKIYKCNISSVNEINFNYKFKLS